MRFAVVDDELSVQVCVGNAEYPPSACHAVDGKVVNLCHSLARPTVVGAAVVCVEVNVDCFPV